MPKFTFTLVLGMLLWVQWLPAQRGDDWQLESARFGRVGLDLLEMESYPKNPEAPVVILNDIGEASLRMLNSKRLMRYRYHRRIKFFAEEGGAYTDIRIPFDASKYDLMAVRAITHNINAQGEPVAFEVDRRDIEVVKLEGMQREIRFRLPVVKVGSVAEYFVEFSSDQLTLLRPWQFQQELPVALSEFHLLLPNNYSYEVLEQGDTRSMLSLERPFAYDAPSQTERSMFGSIGPSAMQSDSWSDLGGGHFIFLMQNQPALKAEAFTSSNANLLPGLRFQLSDAPENTAGEGVFSRWDQLERYVLRRQKPRRLKADDDWVEQQTGRITRSRSGQQEKAEAIFGWVRRNLKWDQTYDIWPNQRLEDLTEGNAGNSAALNLTLMLMLKQAGLDAHPVLISTRDHGPIQVVAANLAQFNHLIVGVNVGSEELLLDALSDLDDLSILPPQDLNQMGYWIDEQNARWVRLASRNQVVRFTYSRFTLSQDGWLTGEVAASSRSYSAALERQRLEEISEEDERMDYLRRNVLTGMSDPRIIDYLFEPQAEEGDAVRISCDLQTRDFVQQAGDLIFIKPMMTKMVEENPFGEEERSTPVDLNFPLRESHLLGLRIPAGYQIEQLPEPIRVKMPGNSGSFIFNVLEMNDIIHVSSTIYLNQTVFLPSEYLAIKTFFDYVVRKHQEDIVLKKVQEDQ